MRWSVLIFIWVIGSICEATPLAGPTFAKGEAPKLESDEFDGTELNLEKWQKEPIGDGWVWLGRPPGLFSPESVTVKNGKMNVTVSELETPVIKNDNEFIYQGAIVRSKHAGKTGWYFETRMKANATEMSSTFWLMTKGKTRKKLELDIVECVGKVRPDAENWVKDWAEEMHSNMIHRVNKFNPKSVSRKNSVKMPTKNWERFYVYAAWWKSKDEVQFFLDGKHVYSIKPNVEWDVPAFIQMAIETYDWNPVPKNGGMVRAGNWQQRTTQYDWVRVWKPKER